MPVSTDDRRFLCVNEA